MDVEISWQQKLRQIRVFPTITLQQNSENSPPICNLKVRIEKKTEIFKSVILIIYV
jgi:hypothetical protein